MFRLLRRPYYGSSCMRTLFTASTFRLQAAAAASENTTIATSAGDLKYEQVWGLWNEGNLFSLTVAQLERFLSKEGVVFDAGSKKAFLVRRVEELLQRRDNQAKGLPPPQKVEKKDQHGRWERPAPPPETLLDLAQAGFYEGSGHMAPKAFQLIVNDTSPDLVVSRVNTTSFPGFPSNAECYTLTAAEADLAIRARYSKALQWCALNMSNLQMDGEIAVDFGKLLIQRHAVKKNRKIVSAWTLQQRLQTPSTPYFWVSTVPEKAIAGVEGLLATNRFQPITKAPQVNYDVAIRRAKDVIKIEMNAKGQVTTVNNDWSNVQTAFLSRPDGGGDVRFLLRSRPPLRRKDIELYSQIPILKLDNEDILDKLAPEHGQLVYTSENETRKWEKKTEFGQTITVTEIKRQPLIIVKDEDDDPRVEYSISMVVPAAGSNKMDLRSIGAELFELSRAISEAAAKPFLEAYETAPQPVTIEKD